MFTEHFCKCTQMGLTDALIQLSAVQSITPATLQAAIDQSPVLQSQPVRSELKQKAMALAKAFETVGGKRRKTRRSPSKVK